MTYHVSPRDSMRLPNPTCQFRVPLDPLALPFHQSLKKLSAPTSPATRHMAQWESARLEAEARLSKESLLFNSPSSSWKPDTDYFLRLWNSEVGESFRKLNGVDKTACQSPISQTSSSTKCGSVSAVTTDICPINTTTSHQTEDTECKSFIKSLCTEDPIDASDSSCSNESEDSSDTALQLLLDFPINNDMSFLETVDHTFATSAAMLTDSSFNISPPEGYLKA
ncbi:hypothetical protein CCACVL1_14161 [Corchorus capsularis]|uniref:Uncharacterized protein n=1 Tax=Corchorus capsularis TaxID=210143 RepID=A0A1R3I802_COCAP|nr:hypothetical protein CCACVL1_14161 [Corchorus capsularis]